MLNLPLAETDVGTASGYKFDDEPTSWLKSLMLILFLLEKFAADPVSG